MQKRLRNFTIKTHVTTTDILMLLFYYKCFIAYLSIPLSIDSSGLLFHSSMIDVSTSLTLLNKVALNMLHRVFL